MGLQLPEVYGKDLCGTGVGQNYPKLLPQSSL